MADTTYTDLDANNPVRAAWLNDVNIVTYRALGAGGVTPTTAAQVRTNLDLPTNTALAASTGSSLVGTIQAGIGAVARTVQDKERDIVSVFDFMTAAQIADVRSGAMTLDVTLPIQNAIDSAIANQRAEVFAPAGLYKTTDTIQLGYGVGFESVVLRGDGYKYRGQSPFNGTAIICTKADRPGVNFQGARGSSIRNIAIIGPLFSYYTTNALGGGGGVPLLDDTNPANWVDGSQAATQESRYAPLAGVSIDAYSGAQPATPYPTVNYPAALGTGQYNKSFSSDVLLDRVYIAGFNTAVVNQPGNSDGNGDFTTLHSCYIEMCKYGISVGNTQSRNVSLNQVKISKVYAVLVNSVHGVQLGKFGGSVTDLSIAGAINLFIFGSFYSGPMTFINLYAEDLWRIGTIYATSPNEQSMVFIAPELKFTSQNTTTRGYPATVLDGGAVAIDIRFIGGVISDYWSVVGFNHLGTVFDGTFFRKDPGDAARANTYQYLAHNGLGGGLILPQLGAPDLARLKIRPYNIDTGAAIFVGFSKKWNFSNRTYCLTYYADIIIAFGSTSDNLILPRETIDSVVAKSSLSAISLTNGVLSITFAARAAWQFMQSGPDNGDVIWDDNSGSVFFVRARTGTVVTAELQNNYKVVAAVKTPLIAFSTTVGNLYFRNSRLYTPAVYLRGDTTAASSIITNCAKDNGSAVYDADISVGDAMFVDDTKDAFVSPVNADIIARSQAAGTITLSAATGMRTQVRRRLDFFIRQPPANA